MMIVGTGADHLHRFAVGGHQAFMPVQPALPDMLEKRFRERGVNVHKIWLVSQTILLKITKRGRPENKFAAQIWKIDKTAVTFAPSS